MALLLALLTGCIFDSSVYERRLLELQDSDGDGVTAASGGGDDCDDADSTVHPGATEAPYDGVDQDCDGEDLVDVDGDGEAALAAGGGDCDDQDVNRHPGAEDPCYDGVDADCAEDDDDDCDRDGHPASAMGGDDCDDSDAEVYPDAPEGWHDLRNDNDCDGRVDDPVRQSLGDADQSLVPPVAEGRFGAALALLPDLEGDGGRELVIAAPEDAGAGASGGAVYLALSSTITAAGRVDLGSEAARMRGEPGDLLGSGLGVGAGQAGDLVFVGALGAGQEAGEVLAFGTEDVSAEGGGPLGQGSAEAWFTGPTDATWFGEGLVVDDFDGDGRDDLVVASSAGLSVWLDPPRGAAADDSADEHLVFQADGQTHWFILSQPGDVDGDGASDLGVTQGGTSAGTAGAALYAGGRMGSAFPDEAYATFVGSPMFGPTSVTATGDRVVMTLLWQASAYVDLDPGLYDPLVDADYELFRTSEEEGFAAAVPVDLGLAGPGYLLGAPLATVGVEQGECVFWPESEWRRGAEAAEMSLRLVGAQPGDRACWGIAVGDDYDADGADDLLIGAPEAEGGDDAGRVYVQLSP